MRFRRRCARSFQGENLRASFRLKSKPRVTSDNRTEWSLAVRSGEWMGTAPAAECLGVLEEAAAVHLQPTVSRRRMQPRAANPEDFSGKVRNPQLVCKIAYPF